MEGYYQETGRAGRDGEAAEAWLCYGLGDVVLLKQMIEQSEAGEERKQLERAKLDHLLGYCDPRSAAAVLLAVSARPTALRQLRQLPDAAGLAVGRHRSRHRRR
jgi:superfamily II DNA helicase RecQ